MIITIDGASGTGKSTVARELARLLHMTYFDTGALYRAIAYLVLKKGVDVKSEEEVAKAISDLPFHIERDIKEERYFLGKEEVTKSLRSPEVTAVASQLAALPVVRMALLPIQKKYAVKRDVIFDGRDLGTVVFPNADVKFFLTARKEVCIERRYRELVEKFPHRKLSYSRVREELCKRDEFDTKRVISPLKCAEDAILVDTSDLTIKEIVTLMHSLYLKKVEK